MKERRWLGLLFVTLLIMMGALIWQFIASARTTVAAGLVVDVLKPLAYLLFAVVFMVLFRAMVKLTRRTTGFKLRTRFFLAILPLTLVPALIIFFLASRSLDNLLINLLIDTNIAKLINRSEDLSEGYLESISAMSTTHGPALAELLGSGDQEETRDYLQRYNLQGAELYRSGLLVNRVMAEGFPPERLARVVESAGPEKNDYQYDDGFFITRFPYRDDDYLVQIIYTRDTDFTEHFRYVVESSAYLKETTEQSEQVKEVNQSILMLVTVALVFAGVWLAMWFSRKFLGAFGVLIHGADQVSKGNFDMQISLQTGDEIDDVVSAFNHMTRTLKENREELEEKAGDLERINTELQGQIRYTEAVVEKSSAGIISADDDGRILTLNPAAKSILDLVDIERGHNIEELLSAPMLAPLLQQWREHEKRGFQTVAKQLEFSDPDRDRHIHVAATIVPLTIESHRFGSVLVLEDLTLLLNAQKLAAWREVAKRVAHEIKNPLTPIQLSIQRIHRKAEKDAPDLKEAIHSAYETVMNETNLLKNLVNEFSTFAKMPAPVKETTNLNALVENLVASYSAVYPKVRLSFDIPEEPVRLRCDATQIRQVLRNLTANAAQASGEGDEIIVGLRKQDAYAVLSVRDHGKGIPDDQKSKVFIPYYSKSPKGTGLGLAIVKRIVEDHDGNIAITDNLPKGSIFTITLPTGSSLQTTATGNEREKPEQEKDR